MLQWMGGSRRKVATSRKSTHKRQKQYFEQRKRQQQQTDGSESYADGMNISWQPHKEHRSLDILSFLNLTTVSQECSSACPNRKEDLEVNASRVKFDISNGPPTILTNTFKEASMFSNGSPQPRNPSGCQVETLSPKKVILSAPDNHNSVFNGTGSKPDSWKTATDQQLSVLDLLGDDGPNGNVEGSPMREAHVAFSVEGLGNVGTETPTHSPQQPGRYFSFGCSSPLKAERRRNSLKNHNMLDDIELEVDAMMQDINMPLGGSCLEFSTGITDSYSNPKQKLAAFRDCMQRDGHSSKINNSRTFYNKNSNEDSWDAGSCFLDDNFLDGTEYNTSWKNWPCEVDGNSMDFMNYGNSGMSDYAFEGPHRLKKRDAAIAMDRFNILGALSQLNYEIAQWYWDYRECRLICAGVSFDALLIESPASYSKHQTSENDHDVMISSGARRPAVERKFEFRDVTSQSDWFCFAREDERDNLSMLSEESCSSSAVRGEATNNSQLNSAVRHSRRHRNAFASPDKKYGAKKTFAKETRYKGRDEIGQGNDAHGSGKCTNMSNPSKSIPPYHSNSTFQAKLGPEDSWFYERGYTSAEMNVDFNPCCRNSETKFQSSCSKLWTEDPFNEFPVRGSHINAKSSFDRSKHGESLACSPSGSFISEKFTFHDSPIISKFEFGFNKPDLSPDSELKGTPTASSYLAGSHGESPFPDSSAEESACKDLENKAKFQPGKREKLEVVEEICNSNGFSENKKAIDASSSKNNNCRCREAKDEAPEVLKQNLKTIYSPDPSEETSSPLKIPDQVKSTVEEKEHRHDDNPPLQLQCRNGNREIEDIGPLERIVSKRASNRDNSSSEVMMLQSYVLQLLCVQKVLKEASAQDTMKKV